MEPLSVWVLWLHEDAAPDGVEPLDDWRLLWLTHINRQLPEASCLTILGDHEWKALYTAFH
ncbi:MAG: hypothetical protein M3380_12995, partial [Chloroflexota bacterium]|nr:hypothetical protein [Chloroflexota bacterium]